MKEKIAFQGVLGAYSHLAITKIFSSDVKLVPCNTFDDVFESLKNDAADKAVIPIDNSIAGRVADIHRLLPEYHYYISGEYFLPIAHRLLVNQEVQSISEIDTVYSHVHALNQCLVYLKNNSLNYIVSSDTAGAAKHLSESKAKNNAVIASNIAAQIYDLKVLKHHIQDNSTNTTRFVIISKDSTPIKYQTDKKYITSMMFNVRNVSAVLYKVLGGFATHDINLTKLESYLVDNTFKASQFYLEAETHQLDNNFQKALEELKFFSSSYLLLGSYLADDFRYTNK